MSAINFKDYRVDVTNVSSDVAEIEVSHIDWNDLQAEIESPHLLVAPSGAFKITTHGLKKIDKEKDLFDFVPKLINLEDEDGNPYFSDFRVANEVVEYLKCYILKVCPDWGKAIPGRRQSHQ
jgi:hypothetical protein